MAWLRTTDDGPVRVLTIDRPERKNAIPVSGWTVLERAFHDFEESGSRILIVTGAGGDFCAGADVDDSRLGAPPPVADRYARLKAVGAAATALHRLTKPTIAAVDGVAVGAGMNLALGCDIVVCSTRARFSEIFVRRGVALDFGGSWLLPRIVGLQRAKELALSGRIVEADEAVRIGLALEVVEAELLMERAMEIAASFLEGAPMAQGFIKQGLNASFQSSFAEAVGWEAESQTVALGTEDAREGFTSFLEKRPPTWKGR
ncbi:MAG TPA: enoyl-CoA hydratase-related protein [Acidimicrobiia bacterium]